MTWPSFASACPMSMIWSSRARKRSFCPLFRRSFGRIESTSAKLTAEENHGQRRRSICKKSSRQTLLSCNCKDSKKPTIPRKTRRLRILHGRLLHVGRSVHRHMEHGLLALCHFLSAERPGRNDDWVVAGGHRRKQPDRYVRRARFVPAFRDRGRAGAGDMDDARAWLCGASVPAFASDRRDAPVHRIATSNERLLVYAAALID